MQSWLEWSAFPLSAARSDFNLKGARCVCNGAADEDVVTIGSVNLNGYGLLVLPTETGDLNPGPSFPDLARSQTD